MTLVFDQVLNYTGRVDLAQGDRLGHDGIGYPYAVADVSYDDETGKSRVYLRRATPEDLKRWAS